VSQYQKGKNNLDFTEARVTMASATLCRQITTPAAHHWLDALHAAQPTASKH